MPGDAWNWPIKHVLFRFGREQSSGYHCPGYRTRGPAKPGGPVRRRRSCTLISHWINMLIDSPTTLETRAEHSAPVRTQWKGRESVMRLGLGAKFTLTVLTILAVTMAANTLYFLG